MVGVRREWRNFSQKRNTFLRKTKDTHNQFAKQWRDTSQLSDREDCTEGGKWCYGERFTPKCRAYDRSIPVGDRKHTRVIC